MTKSVISLAALCAILLMANPVSSQPQAASRRNVFSTLSIGQIVTLNEKEPLIQITTIEGANAGTHKVTEIASDYLAFKDLAGVPPTKLLTVNPWREFTWIEGTAKPKRQFDGKELASILDYFGKHWPGITAASAAVKLAVWSGIRLAEFTGLRWDSLREFGDEVHFDIVGKWGVRRWVRIPTGLYAELERIRMADSPYVFAAYSGQLRAFHAGTNVAASVAEQYKPEAFANWFQDRIGGWVEETGSIHASPHVFRKTALQFARDGEYINHAVAADARLTPSVMAGHYVDEAFRAASNRTYARILASLLQDGIAERYGYIPASEQERLTDELRKATAKGDWRAVKAIADKLHL